MEKNLDEINQKNEDIYYDIAIPKKVPGGFFIYEANEHENLVFADENVIKLFGCRTFSELKDYTNNSFSGMVIDDDLHKIQNEIQAQTMFGEKRHDYVRYRIKSKDGSTHYIEDFGHLLNSADGKKYFYVFIVDVDQNEYYNKNKNSYAEAEILSMNHETDKLTGLFNMSFFYKHVSGLLSHMENRRKEISIIHFDIPNFKLYNERLGFQIGDELLCELARSIRNEFKNDVVSRFSNDHFVVCAFGSHEQILEKVEAVHRNLLISPDPNMRVRVKTGIYHMEKKNTELGLACDHARLACNSIKQRHDKNYQVYNDDIRDQMRKQQYVIDNIDEALKNNYIKVYYQPVIRVKTGKICGYEALVRWEDPKVGLLSPKDFIETLEQFHLIHMIDNYVINQVCSDYKKINEKGDALVPVSINLSRLDFELCDIVKLLIESCNKYDMPHNMLDIEVTESTLNYNNEMIKHKCTQLKNAGFNIWLDDFGSGYSSLNTLTEYDYDVIKLDLVFLKNYENNTKAGALIDIIVKGAKKMGVTSLCEGVENSTHYEFLKSISCEKAQGFYFGKPLPLGEAKRYAIENNMEWEIKVL